MSAFNNRIDAQRAILRVVNGYPWAEPLLGLSLGGIERWSGNSRGAVPPLLIDLVKEAASALFFLANLSQQQVTDEFADASSRVNSIKAQITSVVDGLLAAR